jgi:AraC-like DNA-binding protein/quercetin dioxygenase-like cupin family protein
VTGEIGDGFDVRSLAVTFRPGAVLSRHDHPWGQLVFASMGVMRVATDRAAWLIPPTRAIWLPAGVAHTITMRGEVAMRTLYIAPARAGPLRTEPAALAVEPLLRELILHILAIGMLTPTRADHDRLAGLLIDLLAQAPPQDLVLRLPRDPRALALALRLRDVPQDRRALSVLAGDVGASLRTLQRLFPSETGLALEAWRQKARLIHAVACLASGDSVTAAAFDCGYQTVGAFIAAFRRHFGETPGRYGLGPRPAPKTAA